MFTVYLSYQYTMASFNCYGLGSSREYVAKLVKQYDLVALQETWLFSCDPAVPSTLGVDVNSFSLSSIDVTNGIKAGRPYGIEILAATFR